MVYHIWLVVTGTMEFDVPEIVGMMIQSDELHHFSGGVETTN
jgi:hypothetical protein